MGIKVKLNYHKELTVGRHYVLFGYELKSLSYGITVNRYGIDINLYPFFIGIEFRGVDIDKYFSKLIQYKITQ